MKKVYCISNAHKLVNLLSPVAYRADSYPAHVLYLLLVLVRLDFRLSECERSEREISKLSNADSEPPHMT